MVLVMELEAVMELEKAMVLEVMELGWDWGLALVQDLGLVLVQDSGLVKSTKCHHNC